MRFTALLLWFVGMILCVGGCAQKLPAPSPTEGLVVIPMQAVNNSRAREFLRYFEFFNSSDRSVSLLIRPTTADFWISPLLPQGDYLFDTVVVWSTNVHEVINPENKREISLDTPVGYTVRAGEVTFIPSVLEVDQRMDGAEMIILQQKFRKLTDLEYNGYIDRFISLENGNLWRVSKAR